MQYEAPILTIAILKADDVILLSNIKIEDSGNLGTIEWDTLT